MPASQHLEADPLVIKSTQTVLSVDDMPIESVLSGVDRKILVDHPVDHDEAVILSLGYKQEFRREFSLFTTFGVSFSVLGLLPSIASTLWYSLAYAGNAGITWGYLIGMVGVMAVACSMAEISSAFPTSGGLYYATAMLAPPKYKALLSWIVGWSNYFVQVTGAPSVGYGCASMILALNQITHPDYVFENWHCYLLTVALTFLGAIIASAPTKWIAYINSGSTILNLVFLFISFVVMLGGNNRTEQGLSKFNSNSIAWGIDNQTDWPDGICILLTFMAVIWTMSGFDSPFHLAEECSNAQVATPRAIVMTASIGGILGFVFQLGMAYTIVSVEDAVNDELGQPYIAYLNQIMTQERVLAIGSFAVVLAFTMSFSCMIAASRVLFSYSRDNCFPLSRYWAKVNTITRTPVNAVWANWFIGVLLCLLMFGGVAIDAIFSVGAIGSFISFTVPTLLRITYARKTFIPGPWNLGKFSYACGTLACSFVLLMIPVLNFPQYRGADNTPDLMNWTVVVYWGSMLLAVLWFFVYAHKIYSGPKSNLEKGTVVSGNEATQVIEAVVSSNHDVHFGPDDDAALEKIPEKADYPEN
ncbi:DEKNAAC100645 [Brettanomyces naardenensis]|uniref:DEKNAAC100645 n=1 Tax=Brettanomyces naardenensis TaxID=13370 RepID=A0A448YGF8_BRENA|nr:DEKNAAC100645 [Brettanomyces naardenensis]